LKDPWSILLPIFEASYKQNKKKYKKKEKRKYKNLKKYWKKIKNIYINEKSILEHPVNCQRQVEEDQNI
jgi:hypothetical protein